MISRDQLRKAMSKFATGVTVVTTVDDEGQVHGMTANSFTSVCLEPSLVLVCVAHSTNTYGYLEARGRFAINIVGSEQQEVAQHYAKRPQDRQGGVDHSFGQFDSGVPFLEGSMISMGCCVVGSHVYGDHTVYLAEVEELLEGELADPLIFYESHWYSSVKSTPPPVSL